MGSELTAKTPIFSWLTTSLFDTKVHVDGQPSTFAKAGGTITLCPLKSKDVIRYWTVETIEEGKTVERATALAEQISREMEADCEGHGGGKRRYTLRAEANGSRGLVQSRAFGVELETSDVESTFADADPEISTKTMLASSQRHVEELVRSMLSSHKATTETLEKVSKLAAAQAEMLAMVPKTMIELFQVTQVVAANKAAQEADAYATARRGDAIAEAISGIGKQVEPVVPMLLAGVMQKFTGGGENGGS